VVRTSALAICLLAACDASVSGGGSASESVDASIDDDDDVDAAVEPDAPSACPNGRDIYLSFQGEPLTKATPSDATQNKVSWIGVTSVNLPGYRLGDPDRATKIATITQRIQTALADFPMQVVTTRPMAGPYVMIVFGGNRDQLDTPYSYAVNHFDCGDPVKSDVAWVSDDVPFAKVDDYAIGAIGYGLGLGGTNDPNDCMCGWANGCDQPETSQCTLSSSIAANPVCTGAPNPQDEVAAFETGFCN
jgi:hypothetical protein